jgi:hypothetical protein
VKIHDIYVFATECHEKCDAMPVLYCTNVVSRIEQSYARRQFVRQFEVSPGD